MKKDKLKKFTEFAASLLPHEVDYLLSIQQFADPERLKILEQVRRFCEYPSGKLAFDTRIDKRKYSHLKNWIEERLAAVDVDLQYEWINEMDRLIMTDAVTPEDEKAIARRMKQCTSASFYFTRFYEMLRNYRHFLLIRMRHDQHKEVQQFITEEKAAYDRSRKTFEKIHTATVDIVDQYTRNDTETRRWEQWFEEVFYDEALDGLNRYLAFIRLTFIYYNYREFEKLTDKYDYLDQKFCEGEGYSRRLLVNYYSNRLILHAKFDQLAEAERFGFLSIREQNSEYLHYINNLAAVLLRRNKPSEALALMKEAFPVAKTTTNYHSKTGFVAFYVRCLHANGHPVQAERYAESFLRAHRKELFAHRWHAFFSAYFQVLLATEQYGKLLRLNQKYKLAPRDQQYRRRPGYLPTLSWYHAVSQYKENKLTEDELRERLVETAGPQFDHIGKDRRLKALAEELYEHVPIVFGSLKSMAA